MQTKDLEQLLRQCDTFSSETKKRCVSLIPLLMNKDVHAYNRIRRRLNDLMHSMTNGKNAALVQCALFLLKRAYHGAPALPEAMDDHIITDHAFCTAFRRHLGTSLKSEKDALLALAQKNGWPYAHKDGKIVTFFPKEAA